MFLGSGDRMGFSGPLAMAHTGSSACAWVLPTPGSIESPELMGALEPMGSQGPQGGLSP